jgi:ABC-type branched-subunit amino acid transport system ATPase component
LIARRSSAGQLSTEKSKETALGRALFNKPMVIMADEQQAIWMMKMQI